MDYITALELSITVLYVVCLTGFLWCYIRIRDLKEQLEYHQDLNELFTKRK